MKAKMIIEIDIKDAGSDVLNELRASWLTARVSAALQGELACGEQSRLADFGDIVIVEETHHKFGAPTIAKEIFSRRRIHNETV